MSDPEISYYIAWLGSWYIFYISLTGKVQPFFERNYVLKYVMRPIVLTQLIFCGYMSVSSIFYWLDVHGYYYLNKIGDEDLNLIALTSTAQRCYVLAHASVVHGLLWKNNFPKVPAFTLKDKNPAYIILKISVVSLILTYLFKIIPGLGQFSIKMSEVGFVGSAIAFGLIIPEKAWKLIYISGTLFAVNLVEAILSGWKERIFLPFIFLIFTLIPYYKGKILIIGAILMFILFLVVPTFVSIIRTPSWSGEMKSSDAAQMAFTKIQEGQIDLKENNWIFLTKRFSEVGMFVKYIEKTPGTINYKGFKIIGQGIGTIIPRILYPSKPITEELVMERVLEYGIVEDSSVVSAKTPMITDAYISFGLIGVLIFMFFYGAFASWIASVCENLFGSYIVGSGLIYTGLFQILLRGNCFEFLINALFWSIILLFMLFYLGKYSGYLILNSKYSK